MLKKPITYTNWDDVEVTEMFHFNLSTAELAELELSFDGGMSAMLEKSLESGDKQVILKVFKDIISNSYGIREGERFIKSPELSKEFMESPAFDALFFELITGEDNFNDFVIAIAPKQLKGSMGLVEVDTVQLPATLNDNLDEPDPKPWITEDRDPTKKERIAMSREDLIEALKARDARKACEEEKAVIDADAEKMRAQFDNE